MAPPSPGARASGAARTRSKSFPGARLGQRPRAGWGQTPRHSGATDARTPPQLPARSCAGRAAGGLGAERCPAAAAAPPAAERPAGPRSVPSAQRERLSPKTNFHSAEPLQLLCWVLCLQLVNNFANPVLKAALSLNEHPG